MSNNEYSKEYFDDQTSGSLESYYPYRQRRRWRRGYRPRPPPPWAYRYGGMYGGYGNPFMQYYYPRNYGW